MNNFFNKYFSKLTIACRSFLFSYLLVILLYAFFRKKHIFEIITTAQISGNYNLIIMIIIVVLAVSVYILYSKISSSEDKKQFMFSEALVYLATVMPFLNLSFVNFSWFPIQNIFIDYAIYWQISLVSLASALMIALTLKQQTLFQKLKLFLTRNSFLILVVFMAVFVFTRFVISVYQHANFNTHTYDLGWFDQVIWNLSNFDGFYSTFATNNTHLAHHFQPILFLIAPIYWVFDNISSLFFLEPLIYSLGALPIFWFARDYLKDKFIALGFALSYLFFIGGQYALDYTFHPEIFAVPLIAFAFYFLYKKKYLLHYIFIFLALFTKENISIYIIFISLFSLFFDVNKKVVMVDILVSVIWFTLSTKLIIPLFNPGGYPWLNFSNFGNNFYEIGTNMLFNPLHTLNIFFGSNLKIETLLRVFTSSGMIPLFSPISLIAAAPALIEQFLSSRSTQWDIIYHYSVNFAVPLTLSSIFVVKLIKKRLVKFPIYETVAFFLVLVVLIESIYLRSSLLQIFRKELWQIREESRTMQEIISTDIGNDASVSFTENLGPHLTHRKESRLLTEDPNTEYVVISKAHGFWPYSEEELDNIIQKIKEKQEYRLERSEHDGKILLFKKIK